MKGMRTCLALLCLSLLTVFGGERSGARAQEGLPGPIEQRGPLEASPSTNPPPDAPRPSERRIDAPSVAKYNSDTSSVPNEMQLRAMAKRIELLEAQLEYQGRILNDVTTKFNKLVDALTKQRGKK